MTLRERFWAWWRGEPRVPDRERPTDAHTAKDEFVAKLHDLADRERRKSKVPDGNRDR